MNNVNLTDNSLSICNGTSSVQIGNFGGCVGVWVSNERGSIAICAPSHQLPYLCIYKYKDGSPSGPPEAIGIDDDGKMVLQTKDGSDIHILELNRLFDLADLNK